MAQKGMQDVVYLKNGSIIRGMVIEQVPGVSIKVETADKSVFVYPMDEVEKITKEPAVRSSVANAGIGKGYEGLVQVGYGIGVGLYGEDRAKFNFINGYRFNPHKAGTAPGLSALIAARAAQRMRETQKQQGWMERAKLDDPRTEAATLMLEAEMMNEATRPRSPS